jgi:tRNA (cmo5U34)-methyltransferase
MSKNTWIDTNKDDRTRSYVDEADDFIIERQTTRNIMIRLFSYNFPVQKNLRLLELGCGNGYITQEIYQSFPDNHFSLLDGNKEMIKQAQSICKGENFSFLLHSFEDFFSQHDNPTYDFIYSSNAIHHLNYRQKCTLYQYIFDHLHTGGLFLNIDVVLPPTEVCETWSFQLWREWMHQKLTKRDAPDPDKYNTLPEIYKGKEENQPNRLEVQLETLRKTGFRNVDCFYKYGIFTLFGGTK